MSWILPEPMLTTAVDGPALPAGWAAEPKWDGFRAQLAVHAGGRVLLHSSRRAVTRTRGTSDSARVNSRTPADARVSPGLPRFRGSRRSRAGQRVADPERRP